MDQDAVLQAGLELSEQLKSTEERLTGRLDAMEKRLDSVEKTLTEKIDKVDMKFSVLTDDMMSTKADVKMLQKAQYNI